MIKARKIFSGFAFLFALAATGMLCASLGSPYFIKGTAQNVGNRTLDVQIKCDDYTEVEEFTMCTNFGLFKGVKALNFGFGTRDPKEYKVFEEHKDVYNLNINIAVIVCILCAIIFGLVATVFGLVNTLTVPIETIHGPTGLYIWNAVGAIFSFLAWLMYLVIYLMDIKYNVLSEKDRSDPFFFQTDSVKLGYSFWLLIVGFCLFVVNLFFVFLAQCVQDPKFLWRKRKEDEFATVNKNDVGLGLMY